MGVIIIIILMIIIVTLRIQTTTTVHGGGRRRRVLSNRMGMMEAWNTGYGILANRSGMMQAWNAGSRVKTVKGRGQETGGKVVGSSFFFVLVRVSGVDR